MDQIHEKGHTEILETMDVGATNTGSTGNWQTWQSMVGMLEVMAKVEIGTWDGTDDLDTCKLQQAKNSSGGSAKDLTTSASGGNYDTDAPLDADGNIAILSARVDQMDVANGFTHVRLYCAEVTGTGTDNISGVIQTRSGSAFKERDETAVALSVIYINPNS